MKKKMLLKLALSMLVAFQLNVCSAEEYQEELTLPVGAAFDLEMDDEINGMDYDAKMISYQKIDNRDVPVLTQAGDTMVTIYFKKGENGTEPVKFLLHALPPARYEEVTDQHGDVKPEFQHLYDKKAYEARMKREAATGVKKSEAKPAKAEDKNKKEVKPASPTPVNPNVSNTPVVGKKNEVSGKPNLATGPKPVITAGKPGEAPKATAPAVQGNSSKPGNAAGTSSLKPVITSGKPGADKPISSAAPKTEVKTSVPATEEKDNQPAAKPATEAPKTEPATTPVEAPKADNSALVAQLEAAPYPEKGTFSEQVLYLANIERAKNNLPLLEYSNELLRLSNIRAEEISGYFSHGRPNGSDFKSILPNPKVPCAENLGSGRTNAKEVFASWMRLPAYRANLLSPEYKEMAVGHTFKDNTAHKHYWVMLLRG